MRRFACLALPLSLIACGGPSPSREATVPSPAPSPAPLVDGGTPPRPLPLERHGDWAVGCDNGATCQAGSLAPETGDAPALSLSIERAGGPAGVIVLRLRGDDAPALPLTARVDGDPVARGGAVAGEATELRGVPALALARRMAGGRVVTIADASGRPVATLSLTGLAAALRRIDAGQGRTGTAGAIVAPDSRADTRPAPTLPIVRAAVIRGEAALLDPVLIAQMRRTAGCEGDDLPDATTRPLGHGRTLAIVPCASGAYNLLSALFVVERGAATPVRFDHPAAGDPADDLVYNATFDDGILDSVAKARGLGDCGVAQRYVWDGTRFRLVEQRQMDECRGNIDFIRTWTARVVR